MTLLEGIDDSVLLFVIVIVSIFLLIVWYLRQLQHRHANPQLHPDSIVDVTLTRELLAQQLELNSTRQSRFTRRDSMQCPICLGASDYPIETNCGHLFCANCIVQHWHVKTHNLLHSKIPCPICRQTVTMLLPIFSLDTSPHEHTTEYRSIMRSVNSYNKKFSGAPRPLMDYIYDLPTLLRHAVNELFSTDGLHIWYRIRIVVLVLVAITYLLSPFDLIPESVFGIIGIFDDICIILLIAVYISIFYRQFVANRNE